MVGVWPGLGLSVGWIMGRGLVGKNHVCPMFYEDQFLLDSVCMDKNATIHGSPRSTGTCMIESHSLYSLIRETTVRPKCLYDT